MPWWQRVARPVPEFVRLRDCSPVVRQESTIEAAPPAYGVYRHADVTRVLRDGVTFSSAVIAQGMAEVWGPKIIVGMDAPEHHRHRALVSVAFRQTTLARWEDSLVRRVVDDLIDQFIERGHANLVSEFTFAFPAKVIAGVLGLPEADYRQFQQWAVGIITRHGGLPDCSGMPVLYGCRPAGRARQTVLYRSDVRAVPREVQSPPSTFVSGNGDANGPGSPRSDATG